MSQIEIKKITIEKAEFENPNFYNNCIIKKSIYNIWKDVPHVFNEIEFNPGNGLVKIKADWTNAAKYVQTKMEESEAFFSVSKEEQIKILDKNKEKNYSIPTLEIEVFMSKGDYKQFNSIIKSYLTLIFLTLNIASPGSAEFWDIKINDSKLNFAGHCLGDSWLKSQEYSWPPINKLDLNTVLNWLLKNEILNVQVAKSRTQRIIFSLLNFCRENEIGPAQVIWIAPALEAIVDSPQIGITKTIQDRLFLLLGKPANNIKNIKKQITEFYNLRSRIVHGSFNICNPLMDDYFDDNVNNYVAEFFDPLDFGTSIILSALQKMVVEDCIEYNFIEQYSGVKCLT